MENQNFGPNVIYFILGITESRPAGAFWADKIVFWATNGTKLVVRTGPLHRLAPKPGKDALQIYPLRAWRRPRRVRGLDSPFLHSPFFTHLLRSLLGLCGRFVCILLILWCLLEQTLCRCSRVLAQKVIFFFTSIFWRFFLHFYLLFGSLFEGFFILFPSLFRDLFWSRFSWYFYHFFDFIFFWKPSPTCILLQPASV